MKNLLSVFELKRLKKEKTALNYVCVNCGSDVKELYKKNETTAVLKILNCVSGPKIYYFHRFLHYQVILTGPLQPNRRQVCGIREPHHSDRPDSDALVRL
jgi:hypothetical protein